MPEMDGHTATRLLRADARFKDLPILAMTAHALVEERQRCLEAGMNDHVTKPIDPGALFAAIRRWVKPRDKVAAPTDRTTIARSVDLPDIPGIDVADGLNRVASNRRLYRNLLEQFCDKQADATQQIRGAIASSDRGTAQRLAHTLKGVAGNLGIAQVQAIAARLERAIREGDSTEGLLLAEVESILRSQVEAIRRVLGALADPAPAPPQRSFAPEAAAAAIARLKALIEASDGDAAEAADTVAEALAGMADRERVAALRAAMDDFDFDRAALELQKLSAAHAAALSRSSNAFATSTQH
jgi:HPt (histidine-containing phosphotransfer) domain-containing protein